MGKSEKKSDIVYKEIKRMIIEGELKPMTDISEDEFSRHFQTSRTPVHEAIMKLEEEGFVYVYPRKGTFVSAISLAEMQHVYEIRMLTEPTLIRHACKVISDEKLAGIVDEVFDLRPASIIDYLNLRRPIYEQTAAYGHFGRPDLDLPWEALTKVETLKQYL